MEINPEVRARFDPVAAESAELYKLSRSPDTPRRLRVALRVSYQSITTYDDRATFDAIDIDTIKAEIRNRIFKKGLNANGEQMAPAKEVKNKRARYRYDTGRLWQSLRVKVVRPGTLEMSWEYPGIILGALEELGSRVVS